MFKQKFAAHARYSITGMVCKLQ